MTEAATAQSAHDRRQRRILIGIALMFFAPLAVCFYLYYGPGHWRPGGSVNAGALIDPPRPVPALALPLLGGGSTDRNFLKGKWTFLLVASGPCAEECRRRLYDTRQIRTALDRDMGRVQRLLVSIPDGADPQFLREQHPDLTAVRAGGETDALLARLQEGGAANFTADPRLYLIDPLGNVMMAYGANVKPKGILEDVKRLLRLSSIG